MNTPKTIMHVPKVGIPMALKVIGSILTAINGLVIGFYGLLLLILIFKVSLVVGVVLVLTTIGFWLCFPGAMLSFLSFAFYENIDKIQNRFEASLKASGIFVATIIGSWILYYIGIWVSGLVINFTNSI